LCRPESEVHDKLAIEVNESIEGNNWRLKEKFHDVVAHSVQVRIIQGSDYRGLDSAAQETIRGKGRIS
jgi:hypothetical protein